MFPAFQLTKSKPFTPPSHMASRNSNSRERFSASLHENEHSLCNRSFDTAQNLLNKSGKILRQTKLCVRNGQNSKQNDGPSTSKKNTDRIEFSLMPLPNEKPTNLKRTIQNSSNESSPKHYKNNSASDNENSASTSNPLSNYGRDKLFIMGKVDFCLKMHKLYPKLNIIWDVYGKVIKMLAGNNLGEHILLLRTVNDRGPVIQSIYYDFDNILDNFKPGTSLRAVGEFMNENRLRTFKLEKVDCEKYENAFSRIQNVISFSLLQNNMQTS